MEWRKGKYLYVISALQTALYDINIIIKDITYALDSLHKLLATLHGVSHFFTQSENIQLSHQENYFCLKELEQGETRQPRFTPQRNEEWKKIRKTAKVTGSTLHKAVGLDTLKKQLEHYDRIFKNQEETDLEEATKERLRYGIENEINA